MGGVGEEPENEASRILMNVLSEIDPVHCLHTTVKHCILFAYYSKLLTMVSVVPIWSLFWYRGTQREGQ